MFENIPVISVREISRILVLQRKGWLKIKNSLTKNELDVAMCAIGDIRAHLELRKRSREGVNSV